MPGSFSYTAATNKVVVTGGTSGSPADFASLKAADDAGVNTTLLAASAPGSSVTLTYQVRPVEYRAIPVKFVVASKTTEADYLFITGTDAWGAAQTESVDVSAGNGSYTSTKRWATITDIDCSDNAAGGGTVWADGTIAVTQDIWGVLWKLGSDSTHSVWKVCCSLHIGDESTPTYFAYEYGTLIMDATVWGTGESVNLLYIASNATFRTGKLVDAGFKFTRGKVFWIGVTARDAYEPYGVINGSGTFLLYNTDCMDSSIGGGVCTDINIAGSFAVGSRVWNCTFHGSWQISSYGLLDIYNLRVLGDGAGYGVRGPTNGMVLDRFEALDSGFACYFTYGTEAIELRNVYSRNCNAGFLFYHIQNTYHGVIDADVDFEFPGKAGYWPNVMIGDTVNARLYRRHSVNINVCDKDGTPIENAVVRMENKNGDYTNDGAETRYGINDVLTDSDGNITEQIVSRGYYTDANAGLIIDLSPHKLTISKTGYHTLVIDDITLEKTNWKFELQDAGAEWDDLATDIAAIKSAIGTPVALDSGTATLAGMLTKMADDNGGASFNAETDSLNKINTFMRGKLLTVAKFLGLK